MKHTMKKVGAWLVTLSMVFGLLPMSAFAANLEYTYTDSNGTKKFTITFDKWSDASKPNPTKLADAVNNANDVYSVTLYNGTETLDKNDNYDITVSGGTLTLKDMGDTSNENDITVSGGELTIYLGDDDQLDDVSVSGGTVNFEAISHIDTLTISGGTVNIKTDIDVSPTISGGELNIGSYDYLDYGNQSGNNESWYVFGSANGTGEVNFTETGDDKYLAVTGTFGELNTSGSSRLRAVGNITVNGGAATIDPWEGQHSVTVNDGTHKIHGRTYSVYLNGGTVTLDGTLQSGYSVHGNNDLTKGATVTFENSFVNNNDNCDNNYAYVTGGGFKSISCEGSNNRVITSGNLAIHSGTNDVIANGHNVTIGDGTSAATATLIAADKTSAASAGIVTVKTGATVNIDGIAGDRGTYDSNQYSVSKVVGEGGSVSISNGTHKYKYWNGTTNVSDGSGPAFDVKQPTFSGTFANINMNGRKGDDGTNPVQLTFTAPASGTTNTINGLSDKNPINAGGHDLTVDGIGADGTPVVVTNAVNVTAKGTSVATVTATGTVTAEGSSKVTVKAANTVAASDTANVTVDGAVANGASVATGATLTINDNNTDSSTYVSGTITGTGGTLVNNDTDAVSIKGTFASVQGKYTDASGAGETLTINGTPAAGAETAGSGKDVTISNGTHTLTGDYNVITVSGGTVTVQSGKSNKIVATNGTVNMGTDAVTKKIEISGGTVNMIDNAKVEKTGLTESYNAVELTGGAFNMASDTPAINLTTDQSASNLDVRGIYNNGGTVTLTAGTVTVTNSSLSDGFAYSIYNQTGSVTVDGATVTVNTASGTNTGYAVKNLATFTMSAGKLQTYGGSNIAYGLSNSKTATVTGGKIYVKGEGNNSVFGVNNSGTNADMIIGTHEGSAKPQIEAERTAGTVYGLYNYDGAKARVFGADIKAKVESGTSYGIYTGSSNNISNLQVLTEDHDTTASSEFTNCVLVNAIANAAGNAYAFYAGTDAQWAIRGFGSKFVASSAAEFNDNATTRTGWAFFETNSKGVDGGHWADNTCTADFSNALSRAPLSGGTFVGVMQTNKTNGFADLILENHYVHTGDSFTATNGYDADTTLKSGDKVLANGTSDASYDIKTLSGTHTVFDAEWELRARMANGDDYMLPVNITLGLNDYLHGNSEGTVTVSSGDATRYLDLNGLTVKPVAAASAATYTDQGAISAFTVSSNANLIVKTTQADGKIISDLAADTISNAGSLTIDPVTVGEGESAVTNKVTIENTNNTTDIDAISTTAGTVTVNDGTIRSTSSGDGIHVDGSGASVSVTGGTITGYVDGIHVVNGSLSVSGGDITGTTEDGVHAESGASVSVSNGSITGNVDGIDNAGTITSISGGTITGGTTGCGIDNDGGITTISGGTISGGTTGIDNAASKTIGTISGGTIYGGSSGYGINNAGTITTISGGTIGKNADDSVTSGTGINNTGTIGTSDGSTSNGITGGTISGATALNYADGHIYNIIGGTFTGTATTEGTPTSGMTVVGTAADEWNFLRVDSTSKTGATFSSITISGGTKKLADLFELSDGKDDVLTVKDGATSAIELGGHTLRDKQSVANGTSVTAYECTTGTITAATGTLTKDFTVIPRTHYEVLVSLDSHVTAAQVDNNTNNRYDDDHKVLFVKAGEQPTLAIAAERKDPDHPENGDYLTKVVAYEDLAENGSNVADTAVENTNSVSAEKFEAASDYLGAYVNKDSVTMVGETSIAADKALYVTSGAEKVFTYVETTDYTDGTAKYIFVNAVDSNKLYSDISTETGIDPNGTVAVAEGNAVKFTFTPGSGKAIHSFNSAASGLTFASGNNFETVGAAGTCTKTASTDETLTLAYCAPGAAALKQSASVYVGDTVNVKNNDAHIEGGYTWDTTDVSVATVENGVVTGVKAGTATIKLMDGGTEVASCTVTVNNRYSGGGGGGGGAAPTSYTVKVDNSAVKADKTSAVEGAKVTLTVKAEDAADLVVLDKNGKEVALTKVNATTYTFKMPASNVTVSLKSDEASSVKFVDVPANAYYADAVDWAVAKGITNGVDATHFAPNAGTTRAQVVTFLWRAAGSPAPKGDASQFADVKADAYYAQAVAWAIENGITNGTAADAFSPNAICTRAQIVTFMARFAGVKDVAAETEFVDVDANGYYAAAVAWAVENGITNGVSDTSFAPSNTCTRAQVVTFLFRLLVK